MSEKIFFMAVIRIIVSEKIEKLNDFLKKKNFVISFYAKDLYFALIELSKKEGKIMSDEFILGFSVNEMIEKTNFSRGTFIKSIRELKECGLLKKKKRISRNENDETIIKKIF